MRVLVVEDEKKTASFIRKALQAESFAVDVSHDGSDALVLATSTPFDAIVLDIMLPGRDGLSVLRQLREQRNHTPVLLLSARGPGGRRVGGLHARADDYVPQAAAHGAGRGLCVEGAIMTIRARLTLWYAGILFGSVLLITGLAYHEFARDRNEPRAASGSKEEDDGTEDLVQIILVCGIPAAVVGLAGGWWLVREGMSPGTRRTHAAARRAGRNVSR